MYRPIVIIIMNRKKYNSVSLVSTTAPDGDFHLSRRTRLYQKLNRGEISRDEMKELAAMLAKGKKPEEYKPRKTAEGYNIVTIQGKGLFVEIRIWGQVKLVSLKEYEDHHK